MATTFSTDLYRPEVWADLAQKSFKGKAIIGDSSAVVQIPGLEGNPGDTINFPKWSLLSEMTNIAENAVLVPEKLTQSSSKATILEAGKAVEWSDKAALTGIGNIQDEALRQFGVTAARKVDLDLIGAATATVTGGTTYADGTTATDSAPMKHTIAAGAGGLSWKNIVTAGLLFGDEFDPTSFAGLYINPALASVILNDSNFIQAHQTAQGNTLVQGGFRNGFVGSFLGLPIYLTGRLAATKALLLKQNSLGIAYKRRPLVERDRDILARTTVVATTMHYAVKRLNDEGVVDITVN